MNGEKPVTDTEQSKEHGEENIPVVEVKLPKVEMPTLEENEDVLLNVRAKLYRFDAEEDPPEWKERGVGDVKLLKHKDHGRVRVLMRRDKTLKICANHYVQSYMCLKPQGGSDRIWVWKVFCEFADLENKEETLAIKFRTVEIANKFKQIFEEAKDDCVVKAPLEEKSDIIENKNKKDSEKEDCVQSNDANNSDEKEEVHNGDKSLTSSYKENEDVNEAIENLDDLKINEDQDIKQKNENLEKNLKPTSHENVND